MQTRRLFRERPARARLRCLKDGKTSLAVSLERLARQTLRKGGNREARVSYQEKQYICDNLTHDNHQVLCACTHVHNEKKRNTQTPTGRLARLNTGLCDVACGLGCECICRCHVHMCVQITCTRACTSHNQQVRCMNRQSSDTHAHALTCTTITQVRSQSHNM